MSYYFLYNLTTGQILASSTTGFTPGTGESVLTLPNTNSTAIIAAQFNDRYIVQNGALVEQPYFSLTAATASGSAVFTATLNNPPTTPPTSCTFAVLGQNITATLTANTAMLTLAIHPSVASQSFSVSVTATGSVQATTTAGGTASGVPMQAYQDASKNWHIAPTMKAVLQGYYASLVPEQLVAANTLVGISLLADVVFNVLLTPAVIAALSLNQQNAINDFKANISGVLPLTLANAFPAGGAKEIHYESFEENMPTYAESVTGYNADVVAIPNLT